MTKALNSTIKCLRPHLMTSKHSESITCHPSNKVSAARKVRKSRSPKKEKKWWQVKNQEKDSILRRNCRSEMSFMVINKMIARRTKKVKDKGFLWSRNRQRIWSLCSERNLRQISIHLKYSLRRSFNTAARFQDKIHSLIRSRKPSRTWDMSFLTDSCPNFSAMSLLVSWLRLQSKMR